MADVTQLHEVPTVNFDRPRQLRITLKEIRQIEAHLGKPMAEVYKDLAALGQNAFETLIWIACSVDEPSLTLGKVQKAIGTYVENGGDILDLRPPVYKAIALSGVLGKEAVEQARRPDKVFSANGATPRPPEPSSQESG